ncbi:DUF1800 domain-containing protein [Tropicimonas sp. TH_r6]|uniref:DUF1800 domain-containing protein n=1 Tax=Tropicimonas sp. TH_r6 TaxID=3082085 RepID=UPI0029548A05|nr:DUF1800 domain-containing protein [Tropicimonas sp. TH_r6]MDV7145478.1 DUF1800 domain-containing protein [Tropicimonas sp. TH_r6]
MTIEPALLSIRFGTGRAPDQPDPAAPDELIASLASPERLAEKYPSPDMAEANARALRLAALKRDLRDRTDPESERAFDALRAEATAQMQLARKHRIARALDSAAPLRERLEWFWADHFTVALRGAAERRIVSDIFIAEAIRPHVTGRFADMLKAVVKHPGMLRYLDQAASVGPNSVVARRRPGAGLNENLARELLELHTLGVKGAYGQADVHQLAELLAGLFENPGKGFLFLPQRGEPGAKQVLGRSYGGAQPRLDDIDSFLEDIANHPDTAQHIGRKLAVHFVADAPVPALVNALSRRFRETDGDLFAVAAALVEHPAALVPERTKIRQPMDFIVAGLKSLGHTGEQIAGYENRVFVQRVVRPMTLMGQPWLLPPGPDGWPEEAAHWTTPQGLARRIDWATRIAGHMGRGVPDPRRFVWDALGPLASPRLVHAAAAAETRREGVAIVLASPDFQRR